METAVSEQDHSQSYDLLYCTYMFLMLDESIGRAMKSRRQEVRSELVMSEVMEWSK